MVDEKQEWLQKKWDEFKTTNDRSPELGEWTLWVRRGIAEGDCPLTGISESEIARRVTLAIRDNQIEDAMDDEISWKVRDARANLNNRRYVDGTF